MLGAFQEKVRNLSQKSRRKLMEYCSTHSTTMPERMYRCSSVSSLARISLYLSATMRRSTRIRELSPSSRKISNIRVAISIGVR